MEYKYKTVLLIDDDDIDNILHKMVINSINFADKLIVCKSGEEAINYLQKAIKGEEKTPEMIFLDLRMPMENGFVFLKDYEMLPESLKNNIKIVVVTHSMDEKDLLQSQNNKYVSYFIDKPLTIEKLEELVETI